MEKYRELLTEQLKAASSTDRSVYAREEVVDILLDLWNALADQELIDA